MRPANTTSSGTEVRQWNSPIPYLFGSLALVVALITVALFVLACSYRKRAFNSSDDAEDQKPVKIMDTKAANMDDKPKIVVIMAGDNNPTYLAKPLSSSTHYCSTPGHV